MRGQGELVLSGAHDSFAACICSFVGHICCLLRSVYMASSKTFPLNSAVLATVGWVLLLAGTAKVYSTVVSSKLKIDQVLNPSILLDPDLLEITTNTHGTGQYQYTTSELDSSQASGVMLMSYAWYYNDTDVLVEGYMWWIVAFQLFGIIYSVATTRKLAALCMHVVLTSSTFIYTRTVFSGYLFCLQQTLRKNFLSKHFKSSPVTDVFDGVQVGLAVAFAGCIIVDLANVMIVHALAYEVEMTISSKKTTTLGQAQSAAETELSPSSV